MAETGDNGASPAGEDRKVKTRGYGGGDVSTVLSVDDVDA